MESRSDFTGQKVNRRIMAPSIILVLFLKFIFVINVVLASGFEPLAERLLEAADGRTNFGIGMRNISTHASSLRDGTGNVMEPAGQGGSGFVCKLGFEDGVSWAVKTFASSSYNSVELGVKSLRAIGEFCPEIPVPQVQGDIYTLGNTSLSYYFTDWVEGRSLDHDKDYSLKLFELGKYGLTLPEKAVEEIAQFLYNLTMCPIRNWKGCYFSTQSANE
jgi:hypothetical protein